MLIFLYYLILIEHKNGVTYCVICQHVKLISLTTRGRDWIKIPQNGCVLTRRMGKFDDELFVFIVRIGPAAYTRRGIITSINGLQRIMLFTMINYNSFGVKNCKNYKLSILLHPMLEFCFQLIPNDYVTLNQ